ncbi:MAG: hypothetical protein AB7L66_01760 [Gemmatimonadales bacterium]
MMAAVLAATSCLGTDTQEAALGQEFELIPNESTRISGTQLVVGFRRVAEDLRCPIDAACVADGEAGIEIEVFGTDHSGPILVNTPLPNSWHDASYQVRLVDLLPHPTADHPISPDEYRLRLVVDRLPR